MKIKGEKKIIDKYNKACIPSGYSLFYLECDIDLDHISITNSLTFKITGTDLYGNKLSVPLLNDISLELIKDGIPLNEEEYETNKKETNSGDLYYEIEMNKIGNYQLNMYYKGKEIKTVNTGFPLPTLTFEAGPCYAEDNSHIFYSSNEEFVYNTKFSFNFECFDKYNNKITKGGESFTVSGNIIMSSGTKELTTLEIDDNNNGSYNISFIPTDLGEYIIKLFKDGEQYGKDISLNITEFICSEPTPILCSNNKCAKDYLSCIQPPNGCDIDKPFKCSVSGTETCVKSRTDCDCPSGYIKCDYMHYCVPKDRPDMCPTYNYRSCSKLNINYILFSDGICRDKSNRNSSQIVCPIGKVLCCDLTCRDNYDLCPVTEELPGIKTRCVDQTITNSASECFSTKMCSNPDYVVCHDGECVPNEIQCKPLKCPDNTPYFCNNTVCVKSYAACGIPICGDGKALCENNKCRDSCN